MKKDLNEIARLEKAIADRWGDEAVKNPKSFWTPEKEIKHEKEIKEFYKKKFFKDSKNSKEKYKGFLISKKLLTKESDRNCPVCDSYSFSAKDDLYMAKFECCFGCYVKWVEGREKRWMTGWRPNKEQINGNDT
tara:strand:+ start:62 stop:463 length:402 start_codon:yes stop_codon:yes gene_type:complete